MRHFTIFLLGLLFPLSLLAQGWESDYANIERSIRKVQFPDKSFVITKYGASTTATAAKITKVPVEIIRAGFRKGAKPTGNVLNAVIVARQLYNGTYRKAAVAAEQA